MSFIKPIPPKIDLEALRAENRAEVELIESCRASLQELDRQIWEFCEKEGIFKNGKKPSDLEKIPLVAEYLKTFKKMEFAIERLHPKSVEEVIQHFISVQLHPLREHIIRGVALEEGKAPLFAALQEHLRKSHFPDLSKEALHSIALETYATEGIVLFLMANPDAEIKDNPAFAQALARGIEKDFEEALPKKQLDQLIQKAIKSYRTTKKQQDKEIKKENESFLDREKSRNQEQLDHLVKGLTKKQKEAIGVSTKEFKEIDLSRRIRIIKEHQLQVDLLLEKIQTLETTLGVDATKRLIAYYNMKHPTKLAAPLTEAQLEGLPLEELAFLSKEIDKRIK